MIHMAQAAELSRVDLLDIVQQIQALLFAEADETDREIWNPDKEWNPDLLDAMAELLDRHGLRPVEVGP